MEANKEYLNWLLSARAKFYNEGNTFAYNKVQADIDKLTSQK